MSRSDIERLRHNTERQKILLTLKEYRGVARDVEFEDLRQACRVFGLALAPRRQKAIM